jgi:hypothetical protein
MVGTPVRYGPRPGIDAIGVGALPRRVAASLWERSHHGNPCDRFVI